nr:helix-turn-helix transcriptional regulator [Undibacterium sp. KW1]
MKKSKNLLSSKEIFGRNLRRARRHKEISQEDLALRSDLSRSYVSGVERGIRNVSIDNMDLLAQALGIPIRDLLDPDLFAYVDDKLE